MENRYNCNPNELTQSRITFWFYVGSIPIIAFLFILPYLKAGTAAFTPFSLVYVGLILVLIYFAYRAFRVMQATRNSYCEIRGDRVSGVSTPNPQQKGEPFDIAKSEILGIGKTMVSVGGTRAYNALLINTQDRKYVLLAIDKIDELRQELQS